MKKKHDEALSAAGRAALNLTLVITAVEMKRPTAKPWTRLTLAHEIALTARALNKLSKELAAR